MIAKWVLVVHVGHCGNKSKTELMFVLSTTTIAPWREGLPTLMDGAKGCGVRGLVKRNEKTQVNLIDVYDKAEDIRNIVVDGEGGKFAFTKNLCVLAQLLISYLMKLLTL